VARDRDDARLAHQVGAQSVGVGRGDQRRVQPAAAAILLEDMALGDKAFATKERGVGEEVREPV
jgi:hypothetical protein